MQKYFFRINKNKTRDHKRLALNKKEVCVLPSLKLVLTLNYFINYKGVFKVNVANVELTIEIKGLN